MSWQEEIAEKRKQAQLDKAAQNTHSESINAVKGSGQDMVTAFLNGSKDLAKKDDIDSLLSQLKEVQLSNLLGTMNRPMSITDSASYVGDSIEKLGAKLEAKLDDSTVSDSIKSELLDIKQALDRVDNELRSDKSLKSIMNAISNIEVSPVVNVPTPKVTVPATKIDFKPLQDTIREYFTQPKVEDESISLESYRAQDINDYDRDTQYIGFVNPKGNWYIIENKINDNSMRYLFGNGGYKKAFAVAPQYEYSLLNEAVDALTS